MEKNNPAQEILTIEHIARDCGTKDLGNKTMIKLNGENKP